MRLNHRELKKIWVVCRESIFTVQVKHYSYTLYRLKIAYNCIKKLFHRIPMPYQYLYYIILSTLLFFVETRVMDYVYRKEKYNIFPSHVHLLCIPFTESKKYVIYVKARSQIVQGRKLHCGKSETRREIVAETFRQRMAINFLQSE